VLHPAHQYAERDHLGFLVEPRKHFLRKLPMRDDVDAAVRARLLGGGHGPLERRAAFRITCRQWLIATRSIQRIAPSRVVSFATLRIRRMNTSCVASLPASLSPRSRRHRRWMAGP
jgi:hypothetical protein